MRITALQPLHYRGKEIRPGNVLEVADEVGIEWTKKGLARISAPDLLRVLKGERSRTTPAAGVPISITRAGPCRQ